ncbi:hypothetical protein V8E54_005443 [Elaphomyces granulatus]
MAEILFGMLKADFDTGIKFVLGDPDYRWSLKDHQVHSSKALSGWAGNGVPTGLKTFDFMDEKHKLQEMLVVIEAKAPGNVVAALPQLLVYLAGVQDARLKVRKINKQFSDWQPILTPSFSSYCKRIRRPLPQSNWIDWKRKS